MTLGRIIDRQPRSAQPSQDLRVPKDYESPALHPAPYQWVSIRPALSGLHPISSSESTAPCRRMPSPPLPLPSHKRPPDPFMIPLTRSDGERDHERRVPRAVPYQPTGVMLPATMTCADEFPHHIDHVSTWIYPRVCGATSASAILMACRELIPESANHAARPPGGRTHGGG